jgi:hypothetical protein
MLGKLASKQGCLEFKIHYRRGVGGFKQNKRPSSPRAWWCVLIRD